MTGSERPLTSLDPGLGSSVDGGNTMAVDVSVIVGFGVGVGVGVDVGAVAPVETDEEQQK